MPLEARKPPASSLPLLLLLLALCFGAACGAWIVYDLTRDPKISSSPQPDWLLDEQANLAARDASLARMKELSQALLTYREQMGGSLRWPDSLAELVSVGLLPENFDLTGPLSSQPICLQPEMPPSHDPGLWILAHDRLLGQLRVGGRPGPRNAVIGAAVIFADGSVRYLDEKEVAQYGGLTNSRMQAR